MIRRKERLTVATAALSAMWLASVSPALADEDDARDACRELAQRQDWRDIDTDVRRENDDRYVVRVRGRHDGRDRERICVYNDRTKDADFRDDDRGRDRDEVEEARDACRRVAQGRDWEEVDTDVRREGDDRIVIRVRGERDNDDRERRCIYNTRTNDARFEDQPRNR